jgi:sulfonate transport system permease protein
MSRAASGSMAGSSTDELGAELPAQNSLLPKTAVPNPASRRRRPDLRGALLPIVTMIGWETLVDVGVIPAHRLPAPSQIVLTLYDCARHGLAEHIAVSVGRVLTGFALGSLVAVMLGALVGASRRAEAYLDPTLQALRAIPSLAWVPLLLLWLGIDETPKITLIAIGSFFPVYLNLSAGIRGVDRRQVEVGVLYGLSPLALARRVYIPAALPELFTGLRSGLGLGWMFLVAAELIAATRGVGYLLSDGRETGRPDIVLVAILLFGVLGKLSDDGLRAVERRALHWRDCYSVPSR